MKKSDSEKTKNPHVLLDVDLTPRETEIYPLLIQGISMKEIAFKLGISYKTVDVYRGSIYQKLKVHSIHELITLHYRSHKKENFPAIIASPEKPFIMTFYDNSVFNKSSAWQYRIIPAIFYENNIAAGDSYTFSYSFKSSVYIELLEGHIVDNTPEANFFLLLCNPLRIVSGLKANTEHSGSQVFYAIKSPVSSLPNGNMLFLDMNSDKGTIPVLTFSKFEFIKN